jgi:hypothetical protein
MREAAAAAAKRPFSVVAAPPEPTAAEAGTSGAPPTGSAGPEGEGDLLERLERLGSLRAAGHLSDAEFEAAKARLLSGA